mgnify:CR=1 FL=1
MSNKIQLIQEDIRDAEFLSEDNGAGEKNYYIQGIFMQAEIKNGNGRSYPKRVLSEAIDAYQNEYISKNRGYGELGHPDQPKINLDRVCVLTQEIKEDGNNFIGKAKVIDTPFGNIVRTFLQEGVTLGVSSRGLGGVRNGVVQNGFRLRTAVDVVADPSGPDAFVDAIMENQDSFWTEKDGKLIEEFVDEIKTNRATQINKAQALKNLFEKMS